MSRHLITRIHVLLLIIGALSLPSAARAQSTTEPPPATQDQRLRENLALGDANGCASLLRVAAEQARVAEALLNLGTQIGNELRAICGPSAVASASSLGGGLGTLQATKTVTQFRLARKRIDQRLPPAPPRKQSRDRGWSFLQATASQNLTLGSDPPSGAGIFGEVAFDQRDRTDTSYESGYESDAKVLSVGVDYLKGRTLAGGWIGTTRQTADFTRFGPLFDENTDDASAQLLSQAAVLSSVCGGLSTGGTFEQKATRLGGFVGGGVGGSGFVDAAFGWTRRELNYARSVCALELPGPVVFQNGALRNASNNDIVDDIFAGVLNGISTVREVSFSIRAGGDVGSDAVTFAPRVAFTLTRAATDAYEETGSSTVANPVVPVAGFGLATITRTLGGPIGFELAYDAQSRVSALLEAGGELSGRAGAVAPFASFYWRRELNDDFHLVTARLVQDRRTSPTSFDFGNDPLDRDSFLFGLGVSVLSRDRGGVRVELSRLLADSLFTSNVLSIQARVRF